MDDTFSVVVTDAIVSTSEVQFHWSLASSQMDTDCAETILELVVKKWITIRGFSFTKSIDPEIKAIKIYTRIGCENFIFA